MYSYARLHGTLLQSTTKSSKTRRRLQRKGPKGSKKISQKQSKKKKTKQVTNEASIFDEIPKESGLRVTGGARSGATELTNNDRSSTAMSGDSRSVSGDLDLN